MIRSLLAIAGLMLLWVHSGPICANSRNPILPKSGWPRTVTALGETEEKAREIAFREAAKTITALMRMQDPPMTSFVVTEDFLRDHVVENNGRPGKEVELELADKKKFTFKEWTLTFRTDHQEWWNSLVSEDQAAEQHLRAEARKSHALARQALAARIAFGLAILLIASVGYVRLDRYTHYRYTTWLRVAGVGVASLVIAGCWMILQRG
jgi:hypothetical protein